MKDKPFHYEKMRRYRWTLAALSEGAFIEDSNLMLR